MQTEGFLFILRITPSGSLPAWYQPAWMPAARSVAASRAATVVLPAVPELPTYCTFCAAAGRAACSCSVEAKPSGRDAKY